MSEEGKIAPEAESTVEAPAETKSGEGTVGEAFKATEPAKDAPKEEMVPLSAFLELKKENKAVLKELKNVKQMIEDGASKSEISTTLKDLASEHNIDEQFLQKFAKTVRDEVKKEAQDEIELRLKPIQEKDRAEKIEKVFASHYEKALEDAPEYKDVAKREVIKALSLLPENQNKTFIQLIEETYGHTIQGKRSIDAASSRAGKDNNTDVDVEKAKRDPEYFKEVMANPDLKKKYNEGVINRIASYL